MGEIAERVVLADGSHNIDERVLCGRFGRLGLV